LQALARQQHLTLNTLVQGAWALLLSRYSGEDDVVFGVTTSGRPAALAGVESMVGLFINTLPVRVEVPGEASLLPWLERLQTQQVEREQYAYSPLLEIQGWSEVPRGRPLFESLIVFENYPVDAALQEQTGSLAMSDMRVFERTNYPLTVLVTPGPALSLRLSYDHRRFEAATIRRLAGHFQTLLEGMVTHPQQRLAALPLLTAAERQQVLLAWNATQAAYPQDACLHELFDAQVARAPEAVAVMCDDQHLTYQAMQRRANQLAHHLHSLGVGPDVLVGLCVERSIEMVVGVLGILKAGGAYVPLDPAYPQERLAYMLHDAKVPLLLTQTHLVASLPSHEATVVYLDANEATWAGAPTTLPRNRVTPDYPAYAIYTSGSTGQPKGVLGLHRGAVNRFHWMWQNWPFEANETCCQKTALSFVDAVWEVFGPLLQGIPTVIIPDNVLKDPALLVSTLARTHVTRLVLVPSLLRVLLTTYPDLQQRVPRGIGPPVAKRYQWNSRTTLRRVYRTGRCSTCMAPPKRQPTPRGTIPSRRWRSHICRLAVPLPTCRLTFSIGRVTPWRLGCRANCIWAVWASPAVTSTVPR
jgi:non-ribosomal peptide synthetase component F